MIKTAELRQQKKKLVGTRQLAKYTSTKHVITDSNLKILRSAIILLVEKGYNTHSHTLEARDSIAAKR